MGREFKSKVSTSEALKDTKARHIISFSGGKDSTALAIYMLENYPHIDFEFVFCDTGVELPETYAYIKRFEEIFGITVHHVNALQVHGFEEKEGRIPFDVILRERYTGYLPSPQVRWCTKALKIDPFEHFVGDDDCYSYIAIRGDEQRASMSGGKSVKISQKENITTVYPFIDFQIDLETVKSLLDDSGLGLPPYYRWRSRSGCFFCFYQQIGEWQGLLENHPELFDRAKEYEKMENGRLYTWCEKRSLDQIAKLKKRYVVPKGEDLDGCAICHL